MKRVGKCGALKRKQDGMVLASWQVHRCGRKAGHRGLHRCDKEKALSGLPCHLEWPTRKVVCRDTTKRCDE